MIVEFPDLAFRRREASRQPRRSKNGTPEERTAQAGPPRADRVRKQRRSKNGTPEERAAKLQATSAKIIPLEPRVAAPRAVTPTDDGAISA